MSNNDFLLKVGLTYNETENKRKVEEALNKIKPIVEKGMDLKFNNTKEYEDFLASSQVKLKGLTNSAGELYRIIAQITDSTGKSTKITTNLNEEIIDIKALVKQYGNLREARKEATRRAREEGAIRIDKAGNVTNNSKNTAYLVKTNASTSYTVDNIKSSTEELKRYEKMYRTLKELESKGLDKGSSSFVELKDRIESARKELEVLNGEVKANQQISNIHKNVDTDMLTKRSQSEGYGTEQSEYESLQKYTQALSENNKYKIKEYELTHNGSKAKKKLSEEEKVLVSEYQQEISATQKIIDVEGKKLSNTKHATTAQEKYTKAQKDYNVSLAEANVKGTKQNTLWGSITSNMKQAYSRIFDYTVAYKSITFGLQSLSQGIQFIKELDGAMTNLQIVTGKTKEEVGELVKEYNQMGQDIGATTLEVSKSANEWLRQGYSMEETNTLIKDSMVLSKLGMIDSAEATKYLTSAIKGYGKEAKDAIGIVDMLTAVDMESATSAGGIAEAMSRTASSAKIAGVEMEKLVGLIATVAEVTQKSEATIGESLDFF